MYKMLLPLFCNPLYIFLTQFVCVIYLVFIYICNVEKNRRRDMENKFDYAHFYECYYEQAVCYARKYIFNNEDAYDIVSDSYLRLMELRERLEQRQNVRALFYSIVHNKCMDYLRRLQCYCGVEERLKQTASALGEDEFDALCQKEMFRIIGETLSELPCLQQRIFSEIRMNEKSYQEVAELEGINKRKVEYQLNLATEQLRKRMAQMYG